MDKKELLEKFASLHKNKLYALGGWLKNKNKDFGISDALYAIYNYTGGNINKTNDILEKMTYKKKTYGRTQVYNTNVTPDIDIIRNGNGELTLVNADVYKENPLKGQHTVGSHKPKKGSDGQTLVAHSKKESALEDAGAVLRRYYPNIGIDELEHKLSLVNSYAASPAKTTPLAIAKLIEKGKLKFAKLPNGGLKIMNPSDIIKYETLNGKGQLEFESVNRGRTIVINESMANLLKEELEMTEYKFFSNVKSFLSKLLSDPVNAEPSDILKTYGFNRNKLLRKLLDNNIIEKNQKISDKDENGESKTATMKVKYKVPKKDFNHKLKKLYIKTFEKNVPHKENVNEEGEGATSSDASGQFSQPMFGIQRRTIANIDETDTNSVGNYQYDVPFIGDKETLARKNGKYGSVSINKA